jgi:uncharacterized membrane protein YraQ (UPF0718 family)
VNVSDIQNFVIYFLSVVWEALPFIILGAIIAGVLEEFLPQEALGKLLPKHFLPAVLIGGALGLVFPMCECGIVVVMRRLLKKGLPLSCCVAYMLAGPIVNPIVLGSTAVAFFPHRAVWTDPTAPWSPIQGLIGYDPADGTYSVGWGVLLLRAGLGYLVACVTGLIVHYVTSRVGEKALLTPTALPPAPTPPRGGLSLGMVDAAPAAEPKRSVWQRVSNISSTALNDFIDITVFLIIGSLLSAVVRADTRVTDWVQFTSQSSPTLAVPLLMLLAFVLCLCSEADAFLAASYTKMSVSAKLAFLVFGPMLDIKLLLMYTRVFRPKLILTIVSAVAVQVFLCTTLVHQFYNPMTPGSTVGQQAPADDTKRTASTTPTTPDTATTPASSK